jgi:hypothetical protein
MKDLLNLFTVTININKIYVCTESDLNSFSIFSLLIGSHLVPVLVANNNTVQASISHRFQQVPGLLVDSDGLLLQSTNLRNEVQATLTLLLLKLQGDVTDGSLGNALHKVGGETSNLVTHTLGGGDGDLIDETLVGVEVESETGVVLLDDGACGFLDGLRADSLFFYGKKKRAVVVRILLERKTYEQRWTRTFCEKTCVSNHGFQMAAMEGRSVNGKDDEFDIVSTPEIERSSPNQPQQFMLISLRRWLHLHFYLHSHTSKPPLVNDWTPLSQTIDYITRYSRSESQTQARVLSWRGLIVPWLKIVC